MPDLISPDLPTPLNAHNDILVTNWDFERKYFYSSICDF